MISEKTNTLLAELKARSAAKCLKLTLNEERKPTLFSSKLGGLPYWDLKKDYPTDTKGNPMALLVQLNLAENHFPEPMPSEGILQIFLSVDMAFLYGIDRDAEGRQSNFCVVWHETIDESLTPEQVEALNVPVMTEETYSPVKGEYALDVAEGESYVSTEDRRYGPLLAQIADELYGEKVNLELPWDYVPGLEGDYLREQLAGPSPTHQVFGNPNLQQGDPLAAEKNSHYDTLLLQLDSDTVNDPTLGYRERVMWGDLGIGTFFINADDLSRHDFSNVLYTWVCG